MFVRWCGDSVVDEVRRKKKKYIIVKAYFEKIYDLVNCKILYYMMERLGLCSELIKLIKEYLKSDKFFLHPISSSCTPI